MLMFGFGIQRKREPRVILRSIATLKESELEVQVKSLSPAQWGAVCQIIDQSEAEANNAAADAVANYGICAWGVGGAEHLRLLKDTLTELRNRKKSSQIHENLPSV